MNAAEKLAETGLIAGSFLAAMIVFGIIYIVAQHVSQGTSIIPWGHRRRVERAKADKQVADLRYDTELADLKHLALQPVRNRILQNVDSDTIKPLKELLAGDAAENGDAIREAAWGGEPQQPYYDHTRGY